MAMMTSLLGRSSITGVASEPEEADNFLLDLEFDGKLGPTSKTDWAMTSYPTSDVSHHCGSKKVLALVRKGSRGSSGTPTR